MLIKPEVIEEILKGIGLLNDMQIKESLRQQRETKERLGLILLNRGYINDENIAKMVAEQLGAQLEAEVSVRARPPMTLEEVIKKIPVSFARQHRIVPIDFHDDSITVATDSALNFLAFGNFKGFLGHDVKGILATDECVDGLLEAHYGLKEDEPIDTFVAGMDGAGKVALRQVTEQKAEAEEDTPVVKLVSLLIAEAFKKRASDIHVEPLENKFRIRYRIDGVLHEVPGPPKRLQASVVSRIKIMAGMDIAEKRLPQDGRIRIDIGGKEIDLRVSTLAAIYGESVVLRILDKSSYLIGLKQLGFAASDEKKFEKLIKVPNGILLVTGPTGSGKTTTLYAALNNINKPDRKLITVEDPVEYQISGINQMQVRPQINLTFANGLRSILRQAPDVIMVGEIRDFETAQMAIQASLTGHLVFSTLHTNDAAGAVTRLIDMGIKPYLVASAVEAILAQRLVRVICASCKERYKPTDEELQAIQLMPKRMKKAKFSIGKGCEDCVQTGYKGRIAIFELLVMADAIRELAFEKMPSSVIRDKAKELGMSTLRDDGIKKVLEGITTISEVMRVTQQDVN